ncbi:MAG: hypothetical protein GX942_06810 [Papillibacter sp.]|jgi:hypothetical protein|nr:hypothetical protein [Papillibacter sp.]
MWERLYSIRKNIISFMLAVSLLAVNLTLITARYDPETVILTHLNRRADKKAASEERQLSLLLKLPETSNSWDSTKYHETFRRSEKTITNKPALRTGGTEPYLASISIQYRPSALIVLFFSTLQAERDTLIKYLHKKDGSK